MNGDESPAQPCHRCNADLQIVREAYLAAKYYRAFARRSLLDNCPPLALFYAKKAVHCANTPETRKTLIAALYANQHVNIAAMISESKQSDNFR
jgi:hypothetical protein